MCTDGNLFITGSTRRLYEKKLEKVLDGTTSVTSAPPEPTTLKADSSQNGNTNSVEDHYSDKEEGKSTGPQCLGCWPVRDLRTSTANFIDIIVYYVTDSLCIKSNGLSLICWSCLWTITFSNDQNLCLLTVSWIIWTGPCWWMDGPLNLLSHYSHLLYRGIPPTRARASPSCE